MSGEGMAASPNEPPNLPEGILEELTSRLTRDEAPFLRYLAKELSLQWADSCLLYTSPSPRDRQKSRMPSSA